MSIRCVVRGAALAAAVAAGLAAAAPVATFASGNGDWWHGDPSPFTISDLTSSATDQVLDATGDAHAFP